MHVATSVTEPVTLIFLLFSSLDSVGGNGSWAKIGGREETYSLCLMEVFLSLMKDCLLCFHRV